MPNFTITNVIFPIKIIVWNIKMVFVKYVQVVILMIVRQILVKRIIMNSFVNNVVAKKIQNVLNIALMLIIVKKWLGMVNVSNVSKIIFWVLIKGDVITTVMMLDVNS